MLRRIRAAVVLGALWSFAWALLGAVWALLLHTQEGPQFTDVISPPHAFYEDMPIPVLIYTILGFTTGAVFALFMGVAEARHSIADLRSWRVATWGALAGLVPPAVATGIDYYLHPDNYVGALFIPYLLTVVAIAVILGAVCAGLTLSLARRPL